MWPFILLRYFMICDHCAYYAYDDTDGEWYCDADMDEDDVYRLESENYRTCPYFRDNNEYAVVKHQI